MKKIYLFICLMLVIAISHAQTLQWAKQIGITNNVSPSSIAIDGAGNVYTTGYFYGRADFDPGPATFDLISNGLDDIFVSKLDGAGNFVWTKKIGGTLNDIGTFITVDGIGNIYATGYFTGTVDFDPGPGVFNLTAAGNRDAFIIKLDAAGNFVWVRQVGGASANSEGNSIVLDGTGNIYTGGSFSGTVDFDPGAGTFNLTVANNLDGVFVNKLDATGNFIWAKQMATATRSYDDESISIAVDGSGNVYTGSFFEDTPDFDPGLGTFNLTAAGMEDIFISKLDAAGNFLWAKSIGGAFGDQVQSVAVDGSGNVYTTGYFEEGTIDFDPGPGTFNLTTAGDRDIFISKLNTSGNFVWAKQMGGALSDEGYSVVIDGAGNLYIGGLFNGTADFDPGTGTFNLTAAGGVSGYDDMFISKLDAVGNFVWAIQMGGIDDDDLTSLSVNSTGTIYAAGTFGGTADFDPSSGIFNLTAFGGDDIFVAKYTQVSTGVPVTINKPAQPFTIFPNPAKNGNVTITTLPEVVGAALTIYDIDGQKKYDSILTTATSSYTFDYPAGLYFFNFSKGLFRVTIKVNIER